MLIFGPPGLGKTTLAHIIATELGVNLRQTSGPVLERPGDLAALLTNLQPRDVLFVDEIHRLSPVVEEVLYPAMEDFQLDIMIGEGPAARSIKLNLPPFTLVGRHDARRPADLAAARPLRHRAAPRVLQRRGPGAHRARARPASSTCRSMPDGARRIAQRSRGTPRIANRLLRRVRDYAQVRGRRPHRRGASRPRRSTCWRSIRRASTRWIASCCSTIIEKFDGGPVGIDSLAAAIGEERGTLEDVIEPFLIQQGFLMRTARGRIATRTAYLHFGLKLPERASGQPAAVRGRRGERIFIWPARVYWEDTDAGGVVYYANYLRFLERARTEWLRATGHSQHGAGPGSRASLFTVVSVQVDYRGRRASMTSWRSPASRSRKAPRIAALPAAHPPRRRER